MILVGTASEVPRVQDRLVKDLGLSRSLDTNGAVLGAAYKAADCSDGFEVKPFITNDATLFPVQVKKKKKKILLVLPTVILIFKNTKIYI